MVRSGPRESLLLAIRLWGILWILSGIVHLAPVLMTLPGKDPLEIFSQSGLPHFAMLNLLFPVFAGLFAYLMAPTLTRLLLPAPLLNDLKWNPDSRIGLERFAISLIGFVFAMKGVEIFAVNIRAVNGQVMLSDASMGWAAASQFLPGLLFLLAARPLHAFCTRDQAPRAMGPTVPSQS